MYEYPNWPKYQITHQNNGSYWLGKGRARCVHFGPVYEWFWMPRKWKSTNCTSSILGVRIKGSWGYWGHRRRQLPSVRARWQWHMQLPSGRARWQWHSCLGCTFRAATRNIPVPVYIVVILRAQKIKKSPTASKLHLWRHLAQISAGAFLQVVAGALL